MRKFLARLSPARRRWTALLASCDFDPTGQDLDELAPSDVIVCGSPRSGTTLATAALCQEPRSLAVMEPWDALRMPPAPLFASLRDEVASGYLTRGRLDIEHLRRTGEIRWCRDQGCPTEVELHDDGVLALKFPAFWRYLDLLERSRFVVCVRHPVEVIESFGQAGGRLAQGLDYDVAFNRSMNAALTEATADPVLRRILMYDHIHERILAHLDRADVFVLRYERWFTEPDAVYADLGDFVGTPLDRRPVTIEAPRSHHGADTAVATLVRERCRTATELGYAL